MSEFDKTVHIRNSKGEIIKQNHYILRVANGTSKFERPPKSGKWYNPDGTLVNAEESINVMADELLDSKATVSNPTGQAKPTDTKSK